MDPKKFLDSLKSMLDRPLPDAMALAEMGLNPPDNLPANATFADLVVHEYVIKCCSGDTKTLIDLMNRIAGTPTQYVESRNINLTYTNFLDDIAVKDSDRRTLQAPEKSFLLQ